ncbi:MAG: hypothetical protein POELPBGB_03320 [Bacteroidia bacterium]|nr:hypothetical protein [Bacteroidia bacterium]
MKAKEINTLKVNDFLSMFELFNNKDQLKIATVIQKKTLAERWNEFKKRLPDTDITEEDVIKEVKAVRNKRYGKK